MTKFDQLLKELTGNVTPQQTPVQNNQTCTTSTAS